MVNFFDPEKCLDKFIITCEIWTKSKHSNNLKAGQNQAPAGRRRPGSGPLRSPDQNFNLQRDHKHVLMISFKHF